MNEAFLAALVAYQTQKLPDIQPSRPQSEVTRSLVKSPSATRHMRRRIGRGAFMRQREVYQPKAPALFYHAPTKRSRVLRKLYQKEVLVVAAHPDDEVLCCSLKIQDHVQKGHPVSIVFLTDGDALSDQNHDRSKAYGKARREESIKAATAMGIPRDRLFFLNFPDGMLSALSKKPLVSPFTGQHQTLPEAYSPHTPYTLPALQEKLSSLLQKGFSEIYIPSHVHDRHPDHQMAGRLVQRLLNDLSLKRSPAVWEYIVHTKTPSPTSPPHADKLSLIRLFETQFHDHHHAEFMEQFAKKPEVFQKVE